MGGNGIFQQTITKQEKDSKGFPKTFSRAMWATITSAKAPASFVFDETFDDVKDFNHVQDVWTFDIERETITRRQDHSNPRSYKIEGLKDFLSKGYGQIVLIAHESRNGDGTLLLNEERVIFTITRSILMRTREEKEPGGVYVLKQNIVLTREQPPSDQ